MDTKTRIMETALRIFAEDGYEGLGMRRLARESGVSLAVIYHHYGDKDLLLKTVYDAVLVEVAEGVRRLPASGRARRLVDYYWEKRVEVVFISKYFIHFRGLFQSSDGGYLPAMVWRPLQTYMQLPDAAAARLAAYWLSGFVMEYYPSAPGDEARQYVAGSLERLASK